MRSIAGLLLVGLAGCSQGEQQPSAPADPAEARATVLAPVPRKTSARMETPAQLEAPAPPEAPAVNVVMDVMQVVGKTEAEVSVLLGPPASCADIHRARLCKYGPHENEVMFVRDKASMITVQAMDAVAFDAIALVALGLAPATPYHADEHGIRWQSIPGLQEVAIFPGPGNSVDFAYVSVGK